MVDAPAVRWILYPEIYKIVKLPANTHAARPHITMDQFVSIAYSADDVQVICPDTTEVQGSVLHSHGWLVLQLKGAYSIDNGKKVADASRLMRDAQVRVNVSAAFDTDYLLIAHEHLEQARDALLKANYRVEDKPVLMA